MTITTANWEEFVSSLSALSWPEFVRALPRAMRRIVEQSDVVHDEARACYRRQRWSSRSIRSKWHSELFDVVMAIDALREAHDAFLAAKDAEKTREEGLVDALDDLETAIDAANNEAARLAALVAQREAEEGVEALLQAADDADDDAAWAESLEERLDRGGYADCGWNLARENDGAFVVTGWASTRVVHSEDCGDLLLGREPADLLEHAIRGRVVFRVVRDDDGSDEPTGGLWTIAGAVETVEALASTHDVDDWTEAWSIVPRWIDV